jgi:pimeloyl-ACP methyl ester carboxylesterase
MSGSAEVLIVQGLCGVSAPVSNGGLLRDEIGARATLIELPDVDHALPVEKPELVAGAVMKFSRSRGKDRSRANG